MGWLAGPAGQHEHVIGNIVVQAHIRQKDN